MHKAQLSCLCCHGKSNLNQIFSKLFEKCPKKISDVKVRKLKRSEMSGPHLFNFSLCQSFLFCTTILEPNFHLNMQFKNCSKMSNIIWMGKDRIKLTCVSVRSSSFENSALSAIERYCFSLNFFSSDDN